MIAPKLARVLDILSKSPERRSLAQLSAVVSYFGSAFPEETASLLRLLALYMILHTEQANLSKTLEEDSRVYLLSGAIVLENRSNNAQVLIQAPTEIIMVSPSHRVHLQASSTAASVTKEQYKNCQVLSESSSLDEELQFLQQNNYFSRVGLITCLTLLTNLDVRKVTRGQKVGNLSQQGEFVYLVRSGQLQICRESTDQWSGVKSTLELISFQAGEFFGFFQLHERSESEYLIRCKSAYGTLFAFERRFFDSYISVICGDKLKAYQANLTKYLEKHESEAGQTRKLNMRFLTQTHFNQRKSAQDSATEGAKVPLPTLPSKEVAVSNQQQPSFQTRSLSSKQLKHKNPPFEELTRLEFRRSKCTAYAKLRQPLPLSRNEIFYDFFKNNWETSYAKRKLSEHRRY